MNNRAEPAEIRPSARGHARDARIHIGTSGWSYPHWRGVFYPERWPHRRELEYASRRFDSLEINRSFYSLLTPESCRAWYEQTPGGFSFALKGSRFITHNKKLKDVETALANFFASGVLVLEDKTGPIVWQLSERLAFDEDRVAAFFALLPTTTHAAAQLARKHDHRLKRGAYTEVRRSRRLRYAIEPRHESFFTPEFARLARRHGVALVMADSAHWPYTEELTAGFIYARLHGSERTYASKYTDAELDRWAKRIRLWAAGSEPADSRRITRRAPPARKSRDVYIYFDNDGQAHAVANAIGLRERLRDAGTRVVAGDRKPEAPDGWANPGGSEA
jgi:uncharacterized protein YecE (DUF72 family)